MSVGPTGIIGSLAGTPLSQTKGTDADKAAQETSSQAHSTQASKNAEQAAGIGQTSQDEQASDRDADGRRPWELGGQTTGDTEEPETPDNDETEEDAPQSKDPTGLSGKRLDLTG